MHYISEKFQLHHLPNYSLLIKSGRSQDAFMVLNEKNEVLNAAVYDNANPPNAVTKLFSLPFGDVKILLQHESLVLLPSDVSNSNQTGDSVFFDSDFIYSQTVYLSKSKITAHYEFDILELNKWKMIFPEAIFVPEFVVLFDQIESIKNHSKHVLIVQFEANRMDVFLYESGQLHLYNFYEVRNHHDVSFYLLQIAQSFTCQFEQIFYSGTNASPDKVAVLRSFSSNCAPLLNKNNVQIADQNVGDVLNTFTTLLDTPLCEL